MHKRKATASHGIWTILSRIFAKWPTEFGKIFCGKLWALIICKSTNAHECQLNRTAKRSRSTLSSLMPTNLAEGGACVAMQSTRNRCLFTESIARARRTFSQLSAPATSYTSPQSVSTMHTCNRCTDSLSRRTVVWCNPVKSQPCSAPISSSHFRHVLKLHVMPPSTKKTCTQLLFSRLPL